MVEEVDRAGRVVEAIAGAAVARERGVVAAVRVEAHDTEVLDAGRSRRVADDDDAAQRIDGHVGHRGEERVLEYVAIGAEAAGEAELVDARFDRRPALPPVPGTPLGAERMRRAVPRITIA